MRCPVLAGSTTRPMKFALLIYELPESFASRKNDDNDSYLGAWPAPSV
jgi:hypothetical protein